MIQIPLRRAHTTLHNRLAHLAVNGLVFALCYTWTNRLAIHAGARSFTPGLFGHAIPFLPWMVVPYLSSGLAFALAFLVTTDRRQLWLLSQRTLLVTAVAAVCFTLVPLRFPLPRPPVENAYLGGLFSLLAFVDRPFNQLPSLHAVYAIVFWPALHSACRQGAHRLLVTAWLMSLIASTIFTWQHHIADLVAGVALGAAAIRVVRLPLYGRRAVCLAYGVAGVLVGVLLGHPYASWPAAWLGASMLLVALGYARRDADFLHKRRGRHPAWAWLSYGPYLTGYWISWQVVRFAGRAHAPFVQYGPRLWAGRRLTAREARALPSHCYVIDLAAELGEIRVLRHDRYLHVPLLDLHAPKLSVLRQLRKTINNLQQQGHTVFIHCAMGLSRSHLVARVATKGNRRAPVDLPA